MQNLPLGTKVELQPTNASVAFGVTEYLLARWTGEGSGVGMEVILRKWIEFKQIESSEAEKREDITKGAQRATSMTYSEDCGETECLVVKIERMDERKAGNCIIWIYRKENIDHSACNIELQ